MLRRRLAQRFLPALTLASTLLFAASAHADARTEARRHFKNGMQLIQNKQYKQGIAELEKAQELLPHPNVVFNIARTYEQLVDPAFGFTPDVRFDMEGFRNMMALRAEVEGKTTAAPERYLDFSYYDSAMKLVGR